MGYSMGYFNKPQDKATDELVKSDMDTSELMGDSLSSNEFISDDETDETDKTDDTDDTDETDDTDDTDETDETEDTDDIISKDLSKNISDDLSIE